jgi:signal transduction histidine kinase
MINTTNKYLEDKGIEIDFKSNINKKIIQIDVDKFERIILNLLSNAIKFSDKGSPILVSIYSDDKYINISVEDKGMGIPKDKLNFIFTKFAQVDKTLTRNAEGSGVGLSIVKKLTELHGGKINVESKEGQGSKFTISLLNGNIKSKKNNILNKLNMDNEKMHIEFADIYF